MPKRNAVVIGGAQGIGFATCRLLAEDCESLTIVDLNQEGTERAVERLAGSSAKLLGVRADISNKDEVAVVRERIDKEFGPPSILVNSAAIVDDKRFLDSTPADWTKMINVCLYGPMNVLHEFLPGMVDAGYGRVVCMASDSYKLGQARLSYYAAAKAGVVALVKSLGPGTWPFWRQPQHRLPRRNQYGNASRTGTGIARADGTGKIRAPAKDGASDVSNRPTR